MEIYFKLKTIIEFYLPLIIIGLILVGGVVLYIWAKIEDFIRMRKKEKLERGKKDGTIRKDARYL